MAIKQILFDENQQPIITFPLYVMALPRETIKQWRKFEKEACTTIIRRYNGNKIEFQATLEAMSADDVISDIKNYLLNPDYAGTHVLVEAEDYKVAKDELEAFSKAIIRY